MKDREWEALYPKQDTGLKSELALEADPYPDDFWIDFDSYDIPCES